MSMIPSQLRHLVSKSVLNYLQAPPEVQRLVRITKSIQGRYGDKYVFQLSHGTQQIKLYEPHKYRNARETPLRRRVRSILTLAWENPEPNIKERLRYLHRHYPYFLLRDEPVNLRMKNIYFAHLTQTNDLITIYQAINPEHPNPELDILYTEENFAPKREISFAYTGEDEQYFYGVNERTGVLSNLLHFVWGDELPALPRRDNGDEARNNNANDTEREDSNSNADTAKEQHQPHLLIGIDNTSKNHHPKKKTNFANKKSKKKKAAPHSDKAVCLNQSRNNSNEKNQESTHKKKATPFLTYYPKFTIHINN